MQSPPAVRVTRQKDVFYGIQAPNGLYVRIKGEPPASPQPAEDSAGSVSAKHGHIHLKPWAVATWFKSHGQAETAFAHYLGVAPFEIVRVEP